MDWDEPLGPQLCAGNRGLCGGGREKARLWRAKNETVAERSRGRISGAHKRRRQRTALVLMLS